MTLYIWSKRQTEQNIKHEESVYLFLAMDIVEILHLDIVRVINDLLLILYV